LIHFAAASLPLKMVTSPSMIGLDNLAVMYYTSFSACGEALFLRLAEST
jgi:hypothetical protein